MTVAIAITLSAFVMTFIGLRVADARRRAIAALDDSDPFGEDDPRLKDVAVPDDVWFE